LHLLFSSSIQSLTELVFNMWRKRREREEEEEEGVLTQISGITLT